ncbi:endonuclease/exonuclease/phosphatase family protein [Parvularcula lutaonensis]|uniref:Endonuclease/exonuclease/phosphatase family protein n=1 Tax=Parvularcula lutaonensis TaxID=491923 RepID=A0ABV7MCD9_9PROT|nr:endonuclease/exonuclease/phosphatase family protein [Parvularcula lutaonensis]GGY38277.1 endonuclease [Parvularcula lutaonensis]
MARRLLPLLLLVLIAACGQREEAGEKAMPSPVSDEAPIPDEAPSNPEPLRIATFNVSLYRSEGGQLLEDLREDADPQIEAVREVIRRVDPDILVLNEFDHDETGEALALFAQQLDLGYDHWLSLPSNTGVPSGVDYDGDGRADHPEGSREYGNDSFGYGVHPGQYAIAILSRYPIDKGGVRTFRELLWKDMPGNLLPTEFYSEEAQQVFRLSSKTHADVPVMVGDETLHMILAHPTPPGFDGPEDRNGRRNHDEIRLIENYIDGADWLVDDAGKAGGLDAGAYFVIAGDLNADPVDGDVPDGIEPHAIVSLLQNPQLTDPEPRSAGGVEAAERQGGNNLRQSGDPALDTGDFSDSRVGNLRIDYVLPSSNLDVVGSGVFWPAEGEDGFDLVGPGFPPVSSDHRMVWVDLLFPPDE